MITKRSMSAPARLIIGRESRLLPSPWGGGKRRLARRRCSPRVECSYNEHIAEVWVLSEITRTGRLLEEPMQDVLGADRLDGFFERVQQYIY